MIALQIEAKFEGKPTSTFQNDMKNLPDFHPEHVQKSKIWDFYWVLLSKVENLLA